jgi:hypothetical protein
MPRLSSTKTKLLSSAATTAVLLLAGPVSSATSSIDLATLSAISNASLAITSPQGNTASITATTSDGGLPVVIGLSAYVTADDIATGTFAISNNAVNATASGNTTATPNGNLLQISVLPTFVDSAGVTSMQTNTGAVAAVSTDADISAVIADTTATVHELQGNLTVDGNSISTSASSNAAVNTVRVADSVSIDPAGAAGTSPAFVDAGVASGVSAVTADLFVNSVQSSTTGDASATTTNAVIDITVESVDQSTVMLDANRIAATARGNQSTNTIDTGENAATLDMSAAVANYQRLDSSDALATVAGSTLAIAAGTSVDAFGVDSSTVGVTSNTSSAAATANSTAQTLNLSANNVSGALNPVVFGADVGATGAVVDVTVSNFVIANAQDRANSDATASNTAGTVILTATSGIDAVEGDAIIDSSLSVATNMAEAVAVGNNASAAMGLDGNTVGGGAGIISAQSGDATSTTTASVLGNAITLNVQDDLASSKAELTRNTQRAISAGNIVSSALTVDANEVALVGAGGFTQAVTDGVPNNVTSNFAVSSLQSQLGDVTAEALNGGFSIIADDDVTAASTVTNDANTRVAAAYGNDASSRVSIGATVIAAPGFEAIAATVSQQELNANVLARANGDSVVTTSIADEVLDSSVSTSLNTVEALAMGNRTTTSSVMVGATTISSVSAGAASSAGYPAPDAFAASSFNAVSAQVADGTVTASLRDALGSDSSWIETFVGDDVRRSSITSEGNTLRASATANAGVTGVALDATNVNTSSAVVNAQVSSSDVSALLGAEGTGPTAAVTGPGASATPYASNPFTVTVGVGISNTSGAAVTIALNGALTADEVTFLNTLPGVSGAVVGGTSFTLAPAAILPLANFPGLGLNTDAGTGNQILAFSSISAPASLGTPNEGGVTLTALGDIADSTLSVLSNLTSGSVTGNAATNTNAVTGTNIGTGSTTVVASVNVAATEANADYALSNTQVLSGAGTDLVSEVFGTFAVATDLTITESTENSTVAVEGNTQSAAATGNTATNTTTLAASNIGTTAALSSNQVVVDADMDALSNLEVFAEVSDTDTSSISVSANRNQAVAVTNDATNTISALGANVITAGAAVAANADDSTVDAQADFALLSVQGSDGTVDSAAVTRTYNADLASTATGNINTSTITFDANVTIADATANRAANRVTMGDGANLTSTGVAYNRQTSGTAVTSSVDTAVAVAVMSSGVTAPAATSSTITVDGNTSSAMARGNVATTALTASATQITDPTAAAATVDASTGAVIASNIVLSSQSQTDNITANADGVFGISLNDDTATTAVASTNSSVSVSQNVLSSMGVANVASNSVAVSGTTVDTTSALANGQGATAAIAADTDMTLSTVTTSTGSTIEMSANAARAVAVANDATNSSSVSGTNVDITTAAANAALDGVARTSAATHSVVNAQSAIGSVAADVSLSASNQEVGFGSTLGVATGTVAFDSNSALAEASSNRATNSLSLTGDASLAATGTVSNDQNNTATATANASTDMRFELDAGIAGTGPVVATSTATMDGNSTTALARGNVATNALNASGANISGVGTSATTLAGGTPAQTVSATYGVLNAQNNGAVITAAVSGTTYGMALNNTISGASDAATDSTFSVSGNMVMAQATGNTGASSVTLTGLNNATANAAIGSTQTNTGNVVASIASTSIGSTSFGSLTGNAATVGGNTLSSSATGNSVTNLIRRN